MSARVYTPEMIASSFIKQYYDALASRPESLYRFYKEDSNFSFSENQQAIETVTGVNNINEKVKSINFLGTRVDLSEGTVDAQRSETCILIVVTGEFVLPNKPPSPFVQTFFLADQGQSTSFYCRNSILRLMPRPSMPAPTFITPVVLPQPAPTALAPIPAPAVPIPQPMIAPASVSAPAPSQQAYTPVEPELTSPEDVHATMQVKAALASIDDYEESQPESQPASAMQNPPCETEVADEPYEEVHTPEPEPEPEQTGPRSYLDILKRNTKSAVAPAPALAGRTVSRVLPNKEHLPAASGPPKITSEAPKADRGDKGSVRSKPSAASSQAAPRDDSKPAIYINSIPSGVTEDELRTLFAPFGAEVVKRISNNTEKGFAFIDVDSAATVKAILSAHANDPWIIRGTTIIVEERRSGGRPSTGAGPGAASRPPRRERSEQDPNGNTKPPREYRDRGDRENNGDRSSRSAPRNPRPAQQQVKV